MTDVLEVVVQKLDRIEAMLGTAVAELRGEIRGLRADMDGKLDALRADMDGKVDGLRAEMVEMRDGLRAEMAEMHNGLRAEMAEMREEFRAEFRDLRNRSQVQWAHIQDLSVSVSALRDAIHGLDVRVAAVEVRLDWIARGQMEHWSRLHADTDAMRERITKIEDARR